MDALKKFYVFGSFVSGVDEPRDADVFLVVANTVHSESRAPLLRASDSAVLLACYGCGIWRSRQIFRARKSLISRWRGTVEVRFAARFT